MKALIHILVVAIFLCAETGAFGHRMKIELDPGDPSCVTQLKTLAEAFVAEKTTDEYAEVLLDRRPFYALKNETDSLVTISHDTELVGDISGKIFLMLEGIDSVEKYLAPVTKNRLANVITKESLDDVCRHYGLNDENTLPFEKLPVDVLATIVIDAIVGRWPLKSELMSFRKEFRNAIMQTSKSYAKSLGINVDTTWDGDVIEVKYPGFSSKPVDIFRQIGALYIVTEGKAAPHVHFGLDAALYSETDLYTIGSYIEALTILSSISSKSEDKVEAHLKQSNYRLDGSPIARTPGMRGNYVRVNLGRFGQPNLRHDLEVRTNGNSSEILAASGTAMLLIHQVDELRPYTESFGLKGEDSVRHQLYGNLTGVLRYFAWGFAQRGSKTDLATAKRLNALADKVRKELNESQKPRPGFTYPAGNISVKLFLEMQKVLREEKIAEILPHLGQANPFFK